MPVEAIYEPDHMQLVLRPRATSILPGKRVEQKIDQLFEALSVIRGQLHDDDICYSAIDLGRVHKKGEEFSYWNTESTAAWAYLARQQHMHGRLKQWLAAVEGLIVEADGMRRSTSSIWENDEVQLGEIAATTFAAADKSFIPDYIRLLRVWDLDHEVRQGEEIETILTYHGICTETEELLYCRIMEVPGAKWPGPMEQLYPKLKEVHGETLSTLPLFRRIVTELNQNFAAKNAEAYSQIMENLRANPSTPAVGRAKERDLFGYSPHYEDLWNDADLVLADLDAQALR